MKRVGKTCIQQQVLKLRIQELYWLLHVKDYSFAKMTYGLRSVVCFTALYSDNTDYADASRLTQ